MPSWESESATSYSSQPRSSSRHGSNSRAMIPHPRRHSSSYASQNQQLQPYNPRQPTYLRHTSYQSRHSSTHGGGGGDGDEDYWGDEYMEDVERRRRERDRELERRPTTGDTLMMIWDKLTGMFRPSRR
ncbi:hypothetical protein BS50DRAFT_583883 [Corynespora cassiicola Philippines]|uniref:Uncharacterized protein n=1 Tax=Corynespora cassiicola Philippines TaxID=1448308 RepID=A0A2T2P4S5_CORCC|nr:hypothetical protein BS50DRAFT_583883 [Corynespora cassiicola Philippines]